ncbi:glycosyltransferase family 4 protein [Candidatus Woesebacteria bacterium]|nr:glycosyltransferase family 4 protein [Candidatus Woesebacteria bacterium]
MTKKALIVSPYLDHLGGGERYMLSIASVLESLGHDVYFAWDNLEEISKLSLMLGLNLKNPGLDRKVKDLYFKGNAFSMYLATKPYDLVVYLSDGSIPMLGGRRNILHMQVPFHGVHGTSIQNKIKQMFVHKVIVNSEFTKKIVDEEYGLSSVVLYPPVTPINCAKPKEKLILSVGRFEPSLNAKKQDSLIEAMRLLSTQLPDWRLALAGGSSSDEWLNSLKSKATGLPITFYPNATHEELCNLYGKSQIYWHAAGYGIDESKNPELTEHFGISTVEAVSAGCIPLVVPYGGQREIVKSPDLHWESVAELVQKTKAVIANPTKSSYLENIVISDYSVDNFALNFGKLIV